MHAAERDADKALVRCTRTICARGRGSDGKRDNANNMAKVASDTPAERGEHFRCHACTGCATVTCTRDGTIIYVLSLHQLFYLSRHLEVL